MMIRTTHAMAITLAILITSAVISLLVVNESTGRSSSLVVDPLWASTSETIQELSYEADLIVSVETTSNFETEYKSIDLSTDDLTTNKPETFQIPYTITTMRVLESFKGESPEYIDVRQMGGIVDNIDLPLVTDLQLSDDPVFEQGDELLLFLVEVKSIEDRAVYRIVNSAGRFNIDGENVSSNREYTADSPTRPSSYDALVQQIVSYNPSTD